ncbi:YegP family protein [candidate division KSB1 bacterium]|nr:YegP family protein [candidate division KSB1 bacterium]
MNGRFLISRSTDEQFYFNLLAGNGEHILTSELYDVRQSVHTGIASVKLNAPIDQQYHRRTDAQGMPYFVLKAKNGEIIGKSESYSSTAARERGIESVKTNAPAATIEDDSQPA